MHHRLGCLFGGRRALSYISSPGGSSSGASRCWLGRDQGSWFRWRRSASSSSESIIPNVASREQVQRDARHMGLRRLLEQYGEKDTTPLSINQMYDFGQYEAPGRNRSTTLLAAAQFVHEELPVRCAHLIQDLFALPFGLSENSAIQEVVGLFQNSIQEISKHPRPKSSREELELRQVVMGMLKRHRTIVTHMRSALAGDLLSNEERLQLQPFLDRFYTTRIGNRTMLAHYVRLGEEKQPGWVGLINDKCNIHTVVSNAYAIASSVCTYHHDMTPPPVRIVGKLDTEVRYIESHLEYILTEIFHNSIYQTWKHHTHRDTPRRELPEVKVVIAEGEKTISIAVSDQGGGFARKSLDSIWTHLHFPDDENLSHTHQKEGPISEDEDVSFSPNDIDFSPLINGYSRVSPRFSQNGLPVCRLYARHFGGNLSIQVMENFGVDVFVTIPKSGNHPEALPKSSSAVEE
mmetsp:Transcript_22983/g.40674  ORF Transcript_22983/g.40674 Transcript_22983/m.40674 type:complete len:462 (+) Transcript_22983:168-1553(+)